MIPFGTIFMSVFWGQMVLVLFLIAFAKKFDWLCRVPALDVIVSLFTWIPWVAGFAFYGWRGVVASLLAEWAVLAGFCRIHKMIRPCKGPQILTTLNAVTGPIRNYVALIVTLLVLPLFCFIRLSQICLYPVLTAIVRLPKYKQSEWINVSRHKFEGLIGHDLIWCLYCDWMTGVYSLGAEILRNVESFWCPIKFYPEKKCKNCVTDFPDIKDWIPADGTMEEVTKLLKEKYPAKSTRPLSWFGHPDRKKKDSNDMP